MSRITTPDYFDAVQLASLHFQFLEEALKMYLASCYRVIQLSLQARLPYRFDYDDVQDQPLGRLIRLFAKHSPNEALVRTLQGLPKERNYMAHRAYLLSHEEMHTPEKIAAEFEKVRKIADRAHNAVTAVFEEAKAVEALRQQLEQSSAP